MVVQLIIEGHLLQKNNISRLFILFWNFEANFLIFYQPSVAALDISQVPINILY